MVGARREQVTTPLDASKRLAAKIIEMVMYDIPEVKVGLVRVDVYSTFPTAIGGIEQGCILTTTATREQANTADWDAASPSEIVDTFATRYEVDPAGAPRPIDPGVPLENEPLEQSMPPEVQRRRGRNRKSAEE
jgi:hypothetical protein